MRDAMRRRVVITGLGWVTPLGQEIETVWKRLLAGESGIAPTTLFDARTFPTTFAAEVKDYDYEKSMGRFVCCATRAAGAQLKPCHQCRHSSMENGRVG